MKTIKLLAIAAMCAMTLAAQAATTAKAVITISSVGGGSDVMYLLEGTEYAPAYEAGKDVEKIMNVGQAYNINLYAVLGGYNLSTVYTNEFTNLPLVFKSNATETQYTMTFYDVQGTVKLYDAGTNPATEITLASNGTYNFTCAANSTIADRFFINYVAPVPPTPGICHYGNTLQVNYSNGMTVQINNMDDTQAKAPVAITSDSQDIDITDLTAGNQYKVVWNNQTLIIRK